MANYLVTGGAGFIGSHLCELLIAEGHRVTVLDNFSFGKKEYIPKEVSDVIEGDITNLDILKKATSEMDGIFHLAAMSRVGPSIDKFEYCTEQNIIGTQNVLIAARDNNVKKVLYAASSSYYGFRSHPNTLDSLPGCLNPYALSKYVGEQFCEMFDRIYNVDTLSLRLFNVYGPRQPRVGAYALVIGLFLDALKNKQTLKIHGEGKQRRDFIHVKDVARAFYKGMISPTRGKVLNIGSGENISIKELANIISSNQEHIERRAGDAEITLAEITDTINDIDWKPSVSLEEGLNELIELNNVES